MEIGLFQLENLTLTMMPFVFFDLRAIPDETVHPELDRLLARAEKIAPERVLSFLSERAVPVTIPVVLMDDDQRAVEALRAPLERAGYAQVYVVEGGVAGLLREVDL